MKYAFHRNQKRIGLLLLIALLMTVPSAKTVSAEVQSKTAKGEAKTGYRQEQKDGSIVQIGSDQGQIIYTYENSSIADGTVVSLQCGSCKKYTHGKVEGHKTRIVHDISDHASGNVSFSAWYQLNGSQNWVRIGSASVIISNGSFSFVSPAGKSQKEFDAWLSKQNKKMFKGVPKYISSATVKSMKNTVKKITKSYKTDEQKVKAIHDWICQNIQYDKSGNSKGKEHNVEYAYKNKRGVCDAYSQLFATFCGIAGIPCVHVYGYAGDMKDGGSYETNHAWNEVYVRGKWRIVDCTWDSANVYYGSGDSRNSKNRPPSYTYYEIDPFDFGCNHLALGVWYGYSCGGKYYPLNQKNGVSVYKIVSEKKKTVKLEKVYEKKAGYTKAKKVVINGKSYKVL